MSDSKKKKTNPKTIPTGLPPEEGVKANPNLGNAKQAIQKPTPMPPKRPIPSNPPRQQAYNVPEELANIMAKKSIYVDLRMKYLNKKYGYRNAIKCSKKMIKLNNAFFKKIVTLYPELSGRRLSYDDIKKVVIPVG